MPLKKCKGVLIRGIGTYGRYFLIGLWMFCLGIFVGRHTGHVYFETRPFQERIGKMVKEMADKMPGDKKLVLNYYDYLDDPVVYPVKGREQNTDEIMPEPDASEKASRTGGKAETNGADEIPVKHSRKLATLDAPVTDSDKPKAEPEKKSAPPDQKPATPDPKRAQSDQKPSKPEASEVASVKPRPLKTKAPAAPNSDKSASDAGAQAAAQSPQSAYTIQVASYKNFNDAVTQQTILEKKGIATYRVQGKLNGETWYRVRTGSFADYKTAQARLETLGHEGVSGMVMKKE